MVVGDVLDTLHDLSLFLVFLVLFVIRIIFLPNLLRPLPTPVGNDWGKLNAIWPIMGDDLVLAALLAELLPGEVFPRRHIRDLQTIWRKTSTVRRERFNPE